MPYPYIGEIRMFAGNFAPAGWMFCEGQLLPISEYEMLFNLIGTYYGGDGESTFALPDLRGRVPLHQSSSFYLGQTGGVEEVTLIVSQIPAHAHPLLASQDVAEDVNPGGHLLASPPSLDAYRPQTVPNVAMNPSAMLPTGGSQPHTNFQPYLCVNFIISLFGVFPSST